MDWRRHLNPMIFVLLIAGVVGNLLNVELFYGVNAIFGSIATLLILALYGRTLGLIATIITASYTWYLWNHPYGAIALLGETLFVSLVLLRFQNHVAIASSVYWILIGIPFVWATYFFGLEMSSDAAFLAAIKQGTNGIINAIVAGLILNQTSLLKFGRSTQKRQTSVFQTIFNILIAAALVPVLIAVIIDARTVVNEVEKNTQARLDTVSTGISHSIRDWRDQHLTAISLIAKLTQKYGTENRNQLQAILVEAKNSWPDFYGIFILDQNGTTKAFYPETNAKGTNLIGLNFSDRSYFQFFRDGRSEDHVSPVFLARGLIEEPVINLSSRIQANEQFQGVVSASVDLNRIKGMLDQVSGETVYTATLIDGDGNVIASNSPNYKPLSKYFRSERVEDLGFGFYHLWPRAENELPPMSRWDQSSLGRKVSMVGPGDWKLIVEIPLSSYHSFVYDKYIRNFTTLLSLVFVILLGSIWVASRIANPLVQLSDETTDLPEKLQSLDQIRWPQSALMEITILVQNFGTMVDALKKRFQELQQTTREADRANQALIQSEIKAKELAKSQAFLAKAGQTLGASLDDSTILRNLAAFAVPQIADECIVYLVNEKGDLQEMAVAGGDEEEIPAELIKAFEIQKVLATTKPHLLPEVPSHPHGGALSAMCVPLQARGHIFGVLCLISKNREHLFTLDDLRIAEDLALRASVAVDNAKLYAESLTINRVKDEFLATLSHELRTPMNVILGHAELLKETENFEKDREMTDLSVDAIYRNAKAQSQIIADLLDVSAIITGKVSFTPAKINPSEVAAATAESIRFAAVSKGLDLIVDIDPNVHFVQGDPTRLQQIIWNLLSNAVKFTNRGGEVRVRTRAEDMMYFIEISDTGKGIDPNFLPYVFDRFRQEDNSRTRKFGGLGLGLSIVRQLVELHGGTIQALSPGLDCGSTFIVRLPLFDESDHPSLHA